MDRVCLGKLKVSQHINEFPAFYGTQTELAICPSPQPDQSSPCPPSQFLKIHFNISLPSMLRFSKCSLSILFPHQNPVHTAPLPHIHVCYMSHPSNSSWFDYANIWWGVKDHKIPHYVFFSTPVTLFLLGPNIFLSTLFLNTLSLYSSFNMRTKFHTHTQQEAQL